MQKMQTTPQKRKLPWDDDPRLGRFIDDKALFILESVARGHLVGRNASTFFFYAALQPLEWNHKTLVKFLIKTAEEYSIGLKNFATMTSAFAEEYEKELLDPKTNKVYPDYEEDFKKYYDELEAFEKYKKEHGFKDALEDIFGLPTKDGLAMKGKTMIAPPRQPVYYEGAYKWALDEVKRKPQSAEGKLFSKVFDDKFNLADLGRVLKISDWILAVNEPEDSERFMVKKICNDIVDWTSFEVEPDKQAAEILRKDLNTYLEKFINGELDMPSREKRIDDIFVLQNQNIYTFNKHKALLLERFREMQENYGNTFAFENPFGEVQSIEGIDSENIRQRYAARQFFFMHSIFAFEKLDYIKILALGNNWHWSAQNDDRLKCYAKIQLLPLILKELGAELKQTNLYFDDEKSRLFVRGTEIKIRKFSDQYYALRIIFADQKEIGQEWFFSEMAEKYDSEADLDDKKFYNAVYQISQKARAGGFPDFFITTRQSAKINPKYLS